jgi:hypothetical protein
MSSHPQPQQPNPSLIFETMNAYQRTASLRGAIELDLFTAIDEGAATASELAARIRASERGTRILCDYMVVIGFLTKQGDRYSLTPDSAKFLSRRSPAYMGTAVTFLNSPLMLDSFSDVAAIVRNGGAVLTEEGTMAPEHPIWVEFARTMAPLMTMAAESIAGIVGAESGAPWKVLDIAAGHGIFGIAIAKRNPNARIVALDWRSVLEVATENARLAGVVDRHVTLPGSAFVAEYGSDYDLALLTNFLHHFDEATCEILLRKVYASLKPGGRLVTLEFIPNEDRVSPPGPAGFSLIMLGTTASGDAYTFSQLEKMLRNAGFSKNELHSLPNPDQRVVVSQK